MYRILGIETVDIKGQLKNKYYIGTRTEEGFKPFGYCFGDYGVRAGDDVNVTFASSAKGYYIKSISKEV